MKKIDLKVGRSRAGPKTAGVAPSGSKGDSRNFFRLYRGDWLEKISGDILYPEQSARKVTAYTGKDRNAPVSMDI